jgi:predicted dehydrogenase
MTARSGIIGTGFMGEVHARAVRAAGGVVTAVAGSSPEKSAAAAAALHARRGVSADELITADDVDVVHICTRTPRTSRWRSGRSRPASS